MRKLILFITISLFCVCAFGQTGEEIFDANFNVKSKFIDAYYIEPNVVLTPYILQKSNAVFTSNSGSFSVNYYKFKGSEYDPGYNVIEILKNGTSVLQLKSSDGFESISSYVTGETGFYAYSSLDANTVALIFNGYIFASCPSMVSIVIIRNGTAKLVYNKPMFINSITYNKSYGFTMELQSNTVEYINNKPINQPALHKVWFEGSTLSYQ